jgi:hypothetical protein
MLVRTGNDLKLGTVVNAGGQMLTLPADARDKHLYVCGATGAGKSKFLENLIRQDIIASRKSKSGLILIDPHGSLYDSIVAWLACHNLDRPIVLIDLRRGNDWVVSYNVLRQRKIASPSVIVDGVLQAMSYVWGQSGTDATPLFARWVTNMLLALYEKKMTLVDALYLTDHGSPEIREAITAGLEDQLARRDWDFAHRLSVRDFEAQISSTVNRLQRFVRNDVIRCMLGNPDLSFDLGQAIDEGAIVLVNLTLEGGRVSKEDAELLGTLLLADLWTAARERGKRRGLKPFYVYIDECQRFVTPTIAENLDEARGFGLHLTLANQFPGQFLDGSPAGKRLYDSVMENASSKVVFRLSAEDNLKPMAQWLFRGVMDPEQVKHELYSTKVMSYREEYRQAYSRSRGESRGGGQSSASATGSGVAGSAPINDPDAGIESWNTFFHESSSANDSWSESESESVSDVPVLTPVFGKELSHVQFRSLDEQLFRAMAVLFDQEQRQCVVRLVGMHAPVSIFTPTVSEPPVRPERITNYTERLLERLPFSMRMIEALQRVKDREKYFGDQFVQETRLLTHDEPVTSKRRLPSR